MRYENAQKIFYRTSLQEIDEGSLLEWLRKPLTQLAIEISFPNLGKKIYPLSKHPNLGAELLKSLSGLKLRMQHSTVPLGSMVAVGGASLKTDHSEVNVKEVVAHFLSCAENFGKPWGKVKLLKANPSIYFKSREISFLAPEIIAGQTQYTWNRLPKNKLLEKLLQYLVEQRTTNQTMLWLKREGLNTRTASGLLQKCYEARLILTDLWQDRFTKVKPLRSSQVKNTGKDALDSLRTLKAKNKNVDAMLVVDGESSMGLHPSQTADLAMASEFIVSLQNVPQGIKPLREYLLTNYDTEFVPFLDFMDPYKSSFIHSESSGAEPAIQYPNFFLEAFAKAQECGDSIVLDKEIVAQYLEKKKLPIFYAPTFSTSFFMTKKDQQAKAQLWLRNIFVGPGARSLGRYSQFIPALQDSKLLPDLPKNFMFAEIGGAPLVQRHLFLRPIPACYIDVFNTPRETEADRMDLRDLYILYRENLVLLWSKKRQKFIIPVQSNAVNPQLDSHPMGLLLTLVGSQFYSGDLRFPWKDFQQQICLPRIQLGSVILSPQRWNIPSELLLKALKTGDVSGAKHQFRLKEKMQIFSGGAEPFVFLNDRSALPTLRKLASSGPVVQLQERFDHEDALGIKLNGVRRTTEYILPFKKRLEGSWLSDSVRQGERAFASEKVLAVVFKAGRLGQNEILVNLRKFLYKQKNPWFFLRAGKDGEELRIRIFSQSRKERQQLRDQLEQHILQKSFKDTYREFSFENYKAEEDVYFNSEMLSLYHQISVADSAISVRILSLAEAQKNEEDFLGLAAWMSCLNFADLISPAGKQSGGFHIPKTMRPRYNFLRIKAFEEYKTKGKLKDLFMERQKLVDEKKLRETLQKQSDRQRDFFFSRLVHLSLNRLGEPSLLRIEGKMASHSATMIRNKPERSLAYEKR